MKLFFWPVIISLIGLVASYIWGGSVAFFTVALLAVLEVTLSFDNAVVNAKVLKRMDPAWQRRFLTWGIAVAVFGTRFVLPVLIVAAAATLSPLFVLKLAVYDPVAYGHYLESAHVAISAFGGGFLLLVALKYFFDDQKTVHWLTIVEKRLSHWGGIEAIEIAITLSLLLVCALLLPAEAASILTAGLSGVVLFVLIEGVAQLFDAGAASGSAATSLALFIYLNVLDSAFSLDGVVGAFAITSNLILIMLGLSIGALFVRACTVYLVRTGTLASLKYLEHGAHWAVLGLSLAMFGSLFVHIPEPFTGFVGLGFIGLAYWSSLRDRQA